MNSGNRVEFGRLVSRRRTDMQMSLAVLSTRLGGSPGPSFISKVESGKMLPSAELARRLAVALSLPDDILLNAAGYSTREQQEKALLALREAMGADAPVLVHIPVIDGLGPTGSSRAKMLKKEEDAVIADVGPETDSIMWGEVIASREREPAEDQGMLVIQGSGVRVLRHRQGQYLDPRGNPVDPHDMILVGPVIRIIREEAFE